MYVRRRESECFHFLKYLFHMAKRETLIVRSFDWFLRWQADDPDWWSIVTTYVQITGCLPGSIRFKCISTDQWHWFARVFVRELKFKENLFVSSTGSVHLLFRMVLTSEGNTHTHTCVRKRWLVSFWGEDGPEGKENVFTWCKPKGQESIAWCCCSLQVLLCFAPRRDHGSRPGASRVCYFRRRSDQVLLDLS